MKYKFKIEFKLLPKRFSNFFKNMKFLSIVKFLRNFKVATQEAEEDNSNSLKTQNLQILFFFSLSLDENQQPF
jgi:hypothetical protein